MEIFCSIISTVTFDQFNASLLKKIKFFQKGKKGVNEKTTNFLIFFVISV